MTKCLSLSQQLALTNFQLWNKLVQVWNVCGKLGGMQINENTSFLRLTITLNSVCAGCHHYRQNRNCRVSSEFRWSTHSGFPFHNHFIKHFSRYPSCRYYGPQTVLSLATCSSIKSKETVCQMQVIVWGEVMIFTFFFKNRVSKSHRLCWARASYWHGLSRLTHSLDATAAQLFFYLLVELNHKSIMKLQQRKKTPAVTNEKFSEAKITLGSFMKYGS